VVRALLLVAVLSAGCAGPATQLRRENHSLDQDLNETRADLRKERRKNRDLENEIAVLKGKLGDRPKLRVEVMEPETEAAQAPDEEPVEDYDVSYDAGDFDLGGGDDDLSADYAPADNDPPPPPKKTKPAKSAKKAYDAAVAKVKAHDHDGAISALRAFLDAHGDDDLADNAQYWLGEVYYDEKDWARAVVEFRATVDGYPKGNKVPDALLKLGYCYDKLGQGAKARAALQQVVDAYPGTQPARLAAAKLEELP
jgi:tol-pal system protein YbgF